MKKMLLLLLLIVLSNCEIKPRSVEAQAPESENSKMTNAFYNGNQRYSYHEELRNGMNYGIWSLKSNSYTDYRTGYTVAVVNLTKEELEVELLKLQITELHARLEKEKNSGN